MSNSHDKDQMIVTCENDMVASDNDRQWKDSKEYSDQDDLCQCNNMTISFVSFQADDTNVSESEESETEICVKWV